MSLEEMRTRSYDVFHYLYAFISDERYIVDRGHDNLTESDKAVLTIPGSHETEV